MSEERSSESRRTEASELLASVESQDVLSTDPALRITIARDPATSVSLLESLAQDQDARIREQVANNPNTPWSTLECLAWEFPRAFLFNPVGPLHLLEHPERVCTEKTFWDTILREATIPVLWWKWLSSHPLLRKSEAVRLHIQFAGEAAHPFGIPKIGEEYTLLTLIELLLAASAQGMPLPVCVSDTSPYHSTVFDEAMVIRHLQWLARRRNKSKIKQAVAKHPQASEEILSLLSRDRSTGVRASVAAHPRISEEIMLLLSRDQAQEVRSALASNERTPAELLHRLALEAAAQIAVARHPQASAETLRILAGNPIWPVREVVAKHPRVPEDLLRDLANDKHMEVREAVASHSQTPVEVLAMLAKDVSVPVWRAVAGNKRTPGEVWKTLAGEHRKWEWETGATPAATLGDPESLEEALYVLAQDHRWWVRETLAGHPQTPVEALSLLARNDLWEIRYRVACHPRTSTETLALLALDQEKIVRRAVAEHPGLSTGELSLLAQDKEAFVRSAVARHPQTSEAILQILASDRDEGIRWVVNFVQKLRSQIKGLPGGDEWWEHLGSLPTVRKRSPGEQLDWIARLPASPTVCQIITDLFSADWDAGRLRSAFVIDENFLPGSLYLNRQHYQRILSPYLPAQALQMLAASPFWQVRYLVAFHQKTPWATRKDLSQDGNRYVRAMARASLACWPEEEPGEGVSSPDAI